ncbi:polyprenol reductase-like [Lutzomyia longipalpis]|uniref:polyprenol reductase-like n=1 Tax=Lutzomyia longipalpis TaxID=7200 RepID=UPI0024841095|nr:polyprenol reductase-like [Lutzomyia longipalpis]
MWDIGEMWITPLELLYCGMIAGLWFLGLLVGVLEPHLPTPLIQIYRYGKHALKKHRHAVVDRLEVPKSSFRHFYVFAVGITGLTFYLILRTYLGEEAPPEVVMTLLDFLCGTKRTAKGSGVGTLLASFCIFLQCLRRFWETHFVQVFSRSSRINIVHYLVGYVHYLGATLAILAHAPGFVVPTEEVSLSMDQLTLRVVLSGGTFLFAWWHQWRSNEILARLRKNQTGQVVTEKHLMPKGGFFDVVSSPHMLFECLMYVSLVPVLSGNTDWLLVTAWVVTNQAQVAHFTHAWYRETFPHYPKARKALIPGIF